jgi:hypothetical protein
MAQGLIFFAATADGEAVTKHQHRRGEARDDQSKAISSKQPSEPHDLQPETLAASSRLVRLRLVHWDVLDGILDSAPDLRAPIAEILHQGFLQIQLSL